MKQNRKSAIIRGVILAMGIAGLSGCDSMKNINLPHVYGPNEVPAEVINAPRPITVPPVEPDASYPRLGDVPPKPKDFSSLSMIEETKQQMESQRDEADRLKQQVQTPASTQHPQ